MTAPPSLSWLLDHTIPLNRKERFYTDTVLPGIVCADLTELRRLTALMGHPHVDASADPDDAGLVFFTEYGIAESAYGPPAARFAELPTAEDTPDVVFLTTRPTPVLFALEAKMYDRPGGAALRQQLDRQRSLLDSLAERLATSLDVEKVPVAHCALLPAPEAETLQLDPYPVITWEEIRDAYVDVAPAYWLRMLTEALARYDDLVTRTVANDDARLTGAEIVTRYHAGTLPYTALGRAEGLHGARLRDDVETGAWRTTTYHVATHHPGSRNWFPVDAFIALVDPSHTAPGETDPTTARDVAGAIADLRSAVAEGTGGAERVFGEGSVAASLASAPDEVLARLSPHDLRRVASLYHCAATAARLAREQAGRLFDHLSAGHADTDAP